MGTRADFYIYDKKPEWIGSFAFDGYIVAEADIDDISPNDRKARTTEYLAVLIRQAETSEEFRSLVNEYFSKIRHATLPDQGWPWPWNNSKLTDEVYVFKGDRVWRMRGRLNEDYENHRKPSDFCYPIQWQYNDDGAVKTMVKTTRLVLPDMSELKNVTYGERSGAIFISTNRIK